LTESAKGLWIPHHSLLRINELEMMAVMNCLGAFVHLIRNKVVLIMTDNTTVVSYIKNEGGLILGA
jgi:hypothetical protein